MITDLLRALGLIGPRPDPSGAAAMARHLQRTLARRTDQLTAAQDQLVAARAEAARTVRSAALADAERTVRENLRRQLTHERTQHEATSGRLASTRDDLDVATSRITDVLLVLADRGHTRLAVDPTLTPAGAVAAAMDAAPHGIDIVEPLATVLWRGIKGLPEFDHTWLPERDARALACVVAPIVGGWIAAARTPEETSHR